MNPDCIWDKQDSHLSYYLPGPNCRTPDGQIISADQEVQMDAYTTCRCDHHGGMGFLTMGQATCVKTLHPVSLPPHRLDWPADVTISTGWARWADCLKFYKAVGFLYCGERIVVKELCLTELDSLKVDWSLNSLVSVCVCGVWSHCDLVLRSSKCGHQHICHAYYCHTKLNAIVKYCPRYYYYSNSSKCVTFETQSSPWVMVKVIGLDRSV